MSLLYNIICVCVYTYIHIYIYIYGAQAFPVQATFEAGGTLIDTQPLESATVLINVATDQESSGQSANQEYKGFLDEESSIMYWKHVLERNFTR